MTEQSMRILIADDSRPLRTIAGHILGKYGKCHNACDGREAVSKFQAALDHDQPYDLVILDILMPRKNGIDALHEIRRLEAAAGVAEESRVKVVMLSSLDDPKFMLEAQLQAQADYYLTKPLAAEEMQETLVGLGLVQPATNIQDAACGGEPDGK